ncbi:alpha/beta fold hydrolase [Actinoplanes sp. NPDC051633]|uniref:alpha/beta fold hydrolase n=1 Tax=Actinoplanes sp. NPDC051633 TaxID=3155670 RepID=UPI00342F564F
MIVSAGEIRLWTERSGDAADPAVLLINGSEAQGIGWPDALVSRLVEGGLQVIRYDHRDTGESTTVDFDADPYSLADLVADALAVLDGHGLASAHIVGASMGGMIAQWLAAAQPARVRTLTLFATSSVHGGDDLPGPAESFLEAIGAAGDLPRATAAERVEADVVIYRILNGDAPFDEDAARAVATRHFARARDWTKGANHRRLASIEVDPPPLSAIEAPTLVLAAADDPIFPPAHASALAAAIPGARLMPMPDMGHVLFSPGLPDRVAGAIIEHTAREPETAGPI